MSQDDIQYILELLEDAVAEQDWDLVKEAQEYIEDFKKNGTSKYADEE